MAFIDMPNAIAVTFTEDAPQRPIGRAPLEARQAVEMALASQRPGRVVLNLTPDQYHRLKFGR
jgi:hypothetical protein